MRAKMQKVVAKARKHTEAPVVGAGMETMTDGRKRRPKRTILSMDARISSDAEDVRTVGEDVAADQATPLELVVENQRASFVREAVTSVKKQMGDRRLDTIIKHRILADEPKTLAEIGTMVSLSREGVRLLENKFLARLADHMHSAKA